MASMPSRSRFFSCSARTNGQPPAFQGFQVAFQNRVAAVAKPDRQVFGIGHHPYAGGKTHKVVGIGKRVGIVEIVDAPAEAAFPIPPGAVTSHVQVSDAQYSWSLVQVVAHFRPELRPPIIGSSEEQKRIAAHLRVLRGQLGFDDPGAAPHPCFVFVRRAQNVYCFGLHWSAHF